MRGPHIRSVFISTVLFSILLVGAVLPGGAREILPPGFRPLPGGVHALVGGTVVTRPGESLDGAIVVIRDGFIQAVGKDVAAPADARVWDMKGLTIYAGFIESYLPLNQTNQPIATGDTQPISQPSLASGGVNFFGAPGQRPDPGRTGPGYGVAKVTPETRAVRGFSPDKKAIESLRELGFTTAVIAPARGIIRGTSALVGLAEGDPNELVVKPDVFQYIAFETHAEDEQAYPGSLMGVIATVRQSFFDAQHYALDQADWLKKPAGRKRPEFNPSLEAFVPAAEGKQRVLFEPGSALMVDRAARVAGELKLDFALISCGQEWRRPELAKETGATFIVPVNFPDQPKLPHEDDWEQVTLDQLRAWDWAAENPALLRQQGRDIALTTYSLADKKVFRKNLKRALDRGLAETDALAALTTVPAKLCGVAKQLGTIEPGKIANLTIVDGKGYFDPEARVREVWVDGRNYHVQPPKEPKPEAKKDGAGDTEKEAKEKADKEKKETELKELQQKRVARSPLEGRWPITNPPALLIGKSTIWTSSSVGVHTNAWLYIENGKIRQVTTNVLGWVNRGGDNVLLFGEGQEISMQRGGIVIDTGEKHITPGLIDAHSHSAILGAVNEPTLPSTAMCRIGVVAGQSALLALAGWTGEQMAIKKPIALHVYWPGADLDPTPKERVRNKDKWKSLEAQDKERQEKLKALDDFFAETRAYFKAKDQANGDDAGFQKVPAWEAMQPVVRGQIPITIHADDVRQIRAAVKWAATNQFKIILADARDAWKVADLLATNHVPVIFSHVFTQPVREADGYDVHFRAPEVLRTAGVTVGFSGGGGSLVKNLPYAAAQAVAFGLPADAALKGITLYAAQLAGVGDQLGSIEAGKAATLFAADGDILDIRSNVKRMWIGGQEVSLENRHTRLYEKYRQRPKAP